MGSSVERHRNNPCKKAVPGVHWYIARQLPKKVNAFVDMANAVQLSNDAMTNVP